MDAERDSRFPARLALGLALLLGLASMALGGVAASPARAPQANTEPAAFMSVARQGSATRQTSLARVSEAEVSKLAGSVRSSQPSPHAQLRRAGSLSLLDKTPFRTLDAAYDDTVGDGHDN